MKTTGAFRQTRWTRAFALGVAALLLASCSRETGQTAGGLAGADPTKGRRAIERFGCGSCHSIPGVEGARARVGPPLSGLATRARLAGDLPNTPGNLVRWLENPQEVEPGSVMPDLGVGTREARDIAAYLYTLR